MAAERLSMKNIRELYRLRFALKLSQRKVSLCINCGRTTVRDYERRALQAGLDSHEKISQLSDEDLLRQLNLKPGSYQFGSNSLRKKDALPDCRAIHQDLRKKHVTLALLWEEYKEENPEGSIGRINYLFQG